MKWTSAEELVSWLRHFEYLSPEEYLNPTFLKPHHFVTLGLALKKVGCKSLSMRDDFVGYATRMQLWEAIGIPPPTTINKRSPRGRFLPVHAFKKSVHAQINSEIDSLVYQLIDIAQKNSSEENRRSLSICLLEIINNFYDHANTADQFPCLVSAQSWPKGGLIQIAIADSGIGIRTSLNENVNLSVQLLNGNACELASKYGVTSKPNNNHSGYGLTLAKDLMLQCNGSYILMSGNELFSCTQRLSQSIKIDCTWTGTLLILEWPISSRLSAKKIYESWPLPVGMNEDDFF